MTTHYTPWTPEEDAQLRQLFEVERKTKEQIAAIMPGRTRAAIDARTQNRGFKYQGRTDKWTAERDEQLRQLWVVERLTGEQVAERMPGYSRNAIIGRAHRLGLTRTLSEAEARERHSMVVKPRTQPTNVAKAAGPLPRGERQAPVRQGMIRFGGGSLPKSVIPEKPLGPERPTVGPVTLEERRADQCGWPVNEGNPYLYCGAVRGGHRRYCDRHAWLGVGRGRAA